MALPRPLLAVALTLALLAAPAPSLAAALDDARDGMEAFQSGDIARGIRLTTKAILSGELSNQDLAAAYYNRGAMWAEGRVYDRAMADYDQALELDPKMVDAYVSRAFIWQSKEEWGKAITDLRKAMELEPEYLGSYYNLSVVYEQLGQLDMAIEEIETLLKIDPGNEVGKERLLQLKADKALRGG